MSQESSPGAPPPESAVRRFELPAELGGLRLDRALAHYMSDVSRTQLQRWIKEGRVRLDELPALRPSMHVAGGESMTVEIPERRPGFTKKAVTHQVEVLHEDEGIIVVNKPAGMISHPNDKYPGGALSDWARENYGDLPEVQGENRPGIVHRLDRLTSGVMVLGRTMQALNELKRQFKAREVSKRYIALVHGAPRFDSDWCSEPIGHVPRQKDRFQTVPEGEGRPASTFYEVLERFNGFALLAAEPKTGRTHQIRVHFLSLGLPIVGDGTYRWPGALKVPLPEAAPALGRQALHAQRIEFKHPLSEESRSFEAPVPKDIESLTEWLRAEMPGS